MMTQSQSCEGLSPLCSFAPPARLHQQRSSSSAAVAKRLESHHLTACERVRQNSFVFWLRIQAKYFALQNDLLSGLP